LSGGCGLLPLPNLMPASHDLAKCSCQSCEVHLEFPVELAGSSIACPSCGASTLLQIPATNNVPDQISEEPLSFATVLSGFTGGMRGARTPLVYQLGLMLVAGAILILPLLYLAFVAAAGYGVYWWATHFVFLLQGRHYTIYLFLAKLLLYLTPLITGLIVLFFMIKPLLARAGPRAQPLALNPANEPLLFAFVREICRNVGAPMPSRIDVDCNLNASASFRRGFKSFFGDDLVLTIGLPLVAGMNLTQLAGIFAHEFGHFTQSFAMRLKYIIARVNSWFARVIYQRDQWDVLLAEMAADEEDWRVQLLLGIASLGVWFSRALLKPLMWIGIAISSFVSRQMEYNADAYEIELSGSNVFEETTICLATLNAASEIAHKHMRTTWNNGRILPDNFPQFLSLHHSKLSSETITSIGDRVGLEESPWFSTHPASGDRIRCARRAQKPGIFSLDIPAAQIFSNFNVLAHQVSLLHYTDDLGIPQPLINLRAPESFFERPPTREPAWAFQNTGAGGTVRLKIQPPTT
jgi:Zn-dependent protease with chaperone function